MVQARCNGTTKAGARCRGFALPGSAFCLCHDPAKIVQIAEVRSKGGRSRSNKYRAKKQLPAEPLSAEEIHSWLGVVFKAVIGGRIEPGVATAAANVARAMVTVREAGELEERLAALERRLAERGLG